MNYIRRAIHWLFPKSDSFRRLIDEKAITLRSIEHYVHQAGSTKDNYFWLVQAESLYKDLEKAIDDAEIQRGWKINKEIRRLLINGLAEFQNVQHKKDFLYIADSILQESMSKMDKDSWRHKAVVKLLAEKDITNDAWKIKSDLPVANVIKANEILDEHQDNFYEKLMTLNTRTRVLSVAAIFAVLAWLYVAPPIGDFVYQKDLNATELQRNKAALEEFMNEWRQDTSSESVAAVEQPDTLEETAKDSISESRTDSVRAPSRDTTVKRQKYFPPVFSKEKPKRIENRTKYSLVCQDPIHNPRCLSVLVILMGIIGSVVSGFIRTIQFGNNQNLPEQLSGTTILVARIVFATVAALAVYIFLGTGLIILFNTRISFELLLAFCFAAGFSEQLVQKGVENLTKEEMYMGKKVPVVEVG